MKVLGSRREGRQGEVRLHMMRLTNYKAEVMARQLANVVGILNGSAFYILAALVNNRFLKFRKALTRVVIPIL